MLSIMGSMIDNIPQYFSCSLLNQAKNQTVQTLVSFYISRDFCKNSHKKLLTIDYKGLIFQLLGFCKGLFPLMIFYCAIQLFHNHLNGNHSTYHRTISKNERWCSVYLVFLTCLKKSGQRCFAVFALWRNIP
ncbi:hypothetical protein SAMN05216419_100248 [Nitrosomonas cryotolerans]|nr:hypothetical protein SAMN05216419_100248 [Nitrosomonas cryotolerans]